MQSEPIGIPPEIQGTDVRFREYYLWSTLHLSKEHTWYGSILLGKAFWTVNKFFLIYIF